MSSDTPSFPEEPAVRKAMIAALQAEDARKSTTIRAHDQLIQTLRLRIAKLKKQAFGKSSEKIEREIEQVELALEDLLIASADSATTPADGDEANAPLRSRPTTATRASRAVAPACVQPPHANDDLDPGSCCPDCGGEPTIDRETLHAKIVR